MKKLGIYIHIPFCVKKCDYCDFISFSNKNDFVDKYIETIKQEINNYKINKEEYIVSTIYFGGGTPSYIESKYIIDILKTIKQKFNILENAEITIEVNPGTINEKKLTDYYDSGINRISFGLQSTNDDLLKLIGRVHNYAIFLDGYNLARKTGFKNINIDLMIGLPTENLEDVQKDLKEVINLRTRTYISLFFNCRRRNTYRRKNKQKRTFFAIWRTRKKNVLEGKKRIRKTRIHTLWNI